MAIQLINGSGIQYPAIVNHDGSLRMAGIDTTYAQRMDYTSDGYVEYIGLANPNVGTGSLSWQIRKMTYSGTYITFVGFASGTSGAGLFNKSWTDRGTYTYV